MARERWPKALRSSGANQRALRNVSGVFFFAVIIRPVRDPHGHLTGRPGGASPLSHLMKLKNFSRNRPEVTNLNHQYAFRRVDIFPVLHAGCWRVPPSAPSVTPKQQSLCEVVHIWPDKCRRDGAIPPQWRPLK